MVQSSGSQPFSVSGRRPICHNVHGPVQYLSSFQIQLFLVMNSVMVSVTIGQSDMWGKIICTVGLEKSVWLDVTLFILLHDPPESTTWSPGWELWLRWLSGWKKEEKGNICMFSFFLCFCFVSVCVCVRTLSVVCVLVGVGFCLWLCACVCVLKFRSVKFGKGRSRRILAATALSVCVYTYRTRGFASWKRARAPMQTRTLSHTNTHIHNHIRTHTHKT